MLDFLDRSAWIAESERLADASPEIARELVEYLFGHDTDSFYRVAALVFPKYPAELVEFLASRTDPAQDRHLAMQVWEYKVARQQKIADYQVLTGLFDGNPQKEAFLAG